MKLFDENKYGHLPHYLSLGAGVQSSTLALMYAVGELSPMPKAAIFADTQAEPLSVYDWLEWLKTKLPYPVYTVTNGSLEEAELQIKQNKEGKKYRKTLIPSFAKNPDGTKGILGRGCTRDYKINVIRKKVKELEDIPRGCKTVMAVQCIGISTDEFKRMKPSRDPWWMSRFPLIEKRISRKVCLDWMESHGYPLPPRSACVFCPFHSDIEWRRLKTEEPEEFKRAVEFETKIQEANRNDETMLSSPYLHSSLIPLDQVDFRNDVDRGQQILWDEECEGMCGV